MSFGALETGFKALESSFNVEFGRKWPEKVTQGWVVGIANMTWV